MPEISFRAGRLPYDPSLPNLTLRLDTAAVPIPTNSDWLNKVHLWPMYLNDSLGDCTAAGAGHGEQAWTAEASTEVRVTDAAVLKLYELASGYDPTTGANDNGANMQKVLSLWRSRGLGVHKILGFAEIDHNSPAQVRAAIHNFGGVYVGVNFPTAGMSQFNHGQPWSVVPSTNDGGHCIWVGKYDQTSLTCVTWGRQQQMTQQWWDTYVEEAWVVITQEWLDANGSSPAGQGVADLGVEFTALTGEPSPFPVPVPEPAPAPDPAPPVPASADVLAVALRRFLLTTSVPSYVRVAATAWLETQPD